VVPVLATCATGGHGIDGLATLMDRHRAHLRASGELDRRRDRNLRCSVLAIALSALQAGLEHTLAQSQAEVLAEVAERWVDPASAAERILRGRPGVRTTPTGSDSSGRELRSPSPRRGQSRSP
jgi:LAO/AO transport system kinase